jgi:hypothetical protein
LRTTRGASFSGWTLKESSGRPAPGPEPLAYPTSDCSGLAYADIALVGSFANSAGGVAYGLGAASPLPIFVRASGPPESVVIESCGLPSACSTFVSNWLTSGGPVLPVSIVTRPLPTDPVPPFTVKPRAPSSRLIGMPPKHLSDDSRPFFRPPLERTGKNRVRCVERSACSVERRQSCRSTRRDNLRREIAADSRIGKEAARTARETPAPGRPRQRR